MKCYTTAPHLSGQPSPRRARVVIRFVNALSHNGSLNTAVFRRDQEHSTSKPLARPQFMPLPEGVMPEVDPSETKG